MKDKWCLASSFDEAKASEINTFDLRRLAAIQNLETIHRRAYRATAAN